MKKELIEISEVNGIKFVNSVRELYLDLGLDRTNWSRWSKKNIIDDKFFKENVDYEMLVTKTSNGSKVNDYRVSLDMAKHLVMIARTEKSHQYRQYLIDIEKKVKDLPKLSEKDILGLKIINGKANALEVGRYTQIVESEKEKEMIGEFFWANNNH